mgnify:CR=1 FL=1
MKKVEPNTQLLAQAVRVYLSNQRSARAKTKTRAEVEKTTAKMYKQKGTGRARHGAYSAPIFVGGGVAFGPTGTQNYARKLSKAQTRLAISSALAVKAKETKILELGKIKSTKEAVKKIKEFAGSKLIVLGSKELSAGKFFRNIEKVNVISSNSINAYQILKHKNILATETASKEMEEAYVN